MEVIRAAHSGFCFGVKKAVEAAYACVENNPAGRPVYTHGQVIHNRTVTDELEAKGARIVEDLSETVPGSVLIVRSHGESEAFYQEAKERGVELVDTTCPFVKRIHELVHEAHLAGKDVIIVGDRTHPEVIGINGWCADQAYIFQTPEEARTYHGTAALVVSQTTNRTSVFEEVLAVLADSGADLDVQNTICSATRERQDAAAELASQVDAMIVIGGRNSSNSKKLFDICKTRCKSTFFIENCEELTLKDFQNCIRIGVAAGASTPERIIKEVISKMSDNITTTGIETMADFMDEIEASTRLPHNGEIITGTVDQVNDDEVIVNLNCKKDGILTAHEVTLEDGKTLSDMFHVGDEVQAKVIKTDDNEGGILLSTKKLEVNRHWDEINDAHENKKNIEVKVVRIVKGGVIAVYKEVSGFIPLSQLSNRFVESADEFLGQVLTVKVTRVDQKRNRAVFSHKAVLAEERQKRLDEIWETLKVDDIVEGTVMRFTDYGAFVDLGGIDGLLHISEISWGKLKHPDEVLAIGQKINVKILSMNREKGKISLGLKQTTPEPWSVIDTRYHVDDVVKGTVVQLKEYGAFVELEPGLDGLVHISEVANRHVNNISEELTLGQKVCTKILDIDSERKRISLSIKQVSEAEAAAMQDEEAPAAEEAPVEEAPAAEAPAEEVPVEEAPAAE